MLYLTYLTHGCQVPEASLPASACPDVLDDLLAGLEAQFSSQAAPLTPLKVDLKLNFLNQAIKIFSPILFSSTFYWLCIFNKTRIMFLPWIFHFVFLDLQSKINVHIKAQCFKEFFPTLKKLPQFFNHLILQTLLLLYFVLCDLYIFVWFNIYLFNGSKILSISKFAPRMSKSIQGIESFSNELLPTSGTYPASRLLRCTKYPR